MSFHIVSVSFKPLECVLVKIHQERIEPIRAFLLPVGGAKASPIGWLYFSTGLLCWAFHVFSTRSPLNRFVISSTGSLFLFFQPVSCSLKVLSTGWFPLFVQPVGRVFYRLVIIFRQIFLEVRRLSTGWWVPPIGWKVPQSEIFLSKLRCFEGFLGAF